MLAYQYLNRKYKNLDEVRKACGVAFPVSPSDEVLSSLGIQRVEVPMTPEEEQDDIRYQRDVKLRECDYQMMPDYPLSEEDRKKVAAYRQTLRDIPQQANFRTAPSEIVWPAKPNVKPLSQP